MIKVELKSGCRKIKNNVIKTQIKYLLKIIFKLFIFFLLVEIKLAVKIINANLVKSEVVKILNPFITKNLRVGPAFQKYAKSITTHDKSKICLEYFFNNLNLKLYIKIIPNNPINSLKICLFKK